MYHPPLEADAASAFNGHAPTGRAEIVRLTGEVARLEALCRRQGSTLELLSTMVRRLRRGGLALKEHNADLEEQLERLRAPSAAKRLRRERE